jgi:hypothetical protein
MKKKDLPILNFQPKRYATIISGPLSGKTGILRLDDDYASNIHTVIVEGIEYPINEDAMRMATKEEIELAKQMA